MSQLRLHTASGSSCSLHVPAALAAHHRPIVDTAMDALFAGALDDAHPHRASDGTLVVWLSPPEAARAVAEAYAEAYNARRPTLPDDASAEVRQAVELLRETPVGEDPALDAHWTAARDVIAAKVGASVAAKGGRS